MKKNNVLTRWLPLLALPLYLGAPVSEAATCDYIVHQSSRHHFMAEIYITNDSDTVINGWQVGWQYSGDNRVQTSPGVRLQGNNPYTLGHSRRRPLIEPGETVAVRLVGHKGRRSEVEVPQLYGDVCSEPAAPQLIDIKDAVFRQRQADCATYANDHYAAVSDLQRGEGFDLDVRIIADTEACSFISNSIPNHDFNDETANFGGPVTEQSLEYQVTRHPEFAEQATPISQEVKNGIMLNGVLLDIISAGCYKPNSPTADADGNVNIGCASNEPWLLDPLSTESKFGADLHNAHVQPGGQYHYHGSPKAMYDDKPGRHGSPVIGFAADGFPIYGPYFYDHSSRKVRKARSGYTLKQGPRQAINGLNPGGDYTGIYNDDWEFTDAGDLDACNGMTVNGQYGYYAIDEYPWVIKCLSGTPDPSFVRQAATPPPGDGDDERQPPPPPQS